MRIRLSKNNMKLLVTCHMMLLSVIYKPSRLKKMKTRPNLNLKMLAFQDINIKLPLATHIMLRVIFRVEDILKGLCISKHENTNLTILHY